MEFIYFRQSLYERLQDKLVPIKLQDKVQMKKLSIVTVVLLINQKHVTMIFGIKSFDSLRNSYNPFKLKKHILYIFVISYLFFSTQNKF
jgi:hypothetical protein